ncbi:flagellar basal body rod protein FlgB [Andreprevotia chitinilytica]|uniref:flagellar basal body rod protein FlgB n=1 Tax=Andreprevotia chitinilytica TaxID=396808 RepID=UPI0005503CBA|nr:flagellar basal body rod protein FlgB [Andreprevotia chitinilytica]
MLGQINDYFRTSETALKLRSQRQEVIAANIANADTPNYKARDFDFRSAFDAATAKQHAGQMATTDAHHLQPKSGVANPLSPQLQYRNPFQPSIDGNTVEMNTEMREFSDNAIRYQAAITFMQGQISTMKTALSTQ